MTLRCISDVHGLRNEYLEIIKECDYSIQLGDMGFHYDFLTEVDASKHLFHVGNHDDHDEKYKYPHCLKKFGMASHGGIEFFFLEGGFSIDQKYRIEQEQLGIWPKTWWENEELPQDVLEESVRQYKFFRPDVVLTHEPPRTLADLLGDKEFIRKWGYNPDTFTTRTGEALERMFNEHAPKLWIFAHFHKNFDHVVRGTRFICQEELGYLDLEKDLTLRKFSFHSGVEYV